MKAVAFGVLLMTALSWSCGSAYAQAITTDARADLTLHIEDVSPKGGMVRLGLYDRARYPDNDSTPVASADVKATPGEMTITLHNIPIGTYAVQVFQDINSNNKMDTTFLGLPEEPFGFSQDARPFLSKPSFDEVKFDLKVGANLQVIHLQNSVTSSPEERARDAVRARRLQ
jgi:uncharacterized protein (DUF2141 family)